MKEFEITCPLTREPRLREIEAKAGGLKWVLKKRSVDARREPVWRYRYEAYSPEDNYVPYALPEDRDVHGAEPVIIVGAGPAGMFAALKLITLGLRPIILERGKDVHARKADMAAVNLRGEVNPDSNYCYGEGGAGAFSDGKLYTRSSKRGDIREVLHNLVRFGASSDILIDAHPHIGSDKLPAVVENIRKFIVGRGGDPFRLMDFQRSVERSMYDFSFSAGARNPMAAPAQRMEDFCNGRMSKSMPETTYRPGVVSAPLHELLPPMVAERLRKAFPRVKMRSYYTNSALLLGVESRTSSPVRIPRNPETLEYLSIPGLYPCGEGAGYAGGIVSSALDGINVASAVAASL